MGDDEAEHVRKCLAAAEREWQIVDSENAKLRRIVAAADALADVLAAVDLACRYEGSAAWADSRPRCPSSPECWACQMRAQLALYREMRHG